MYIFQPDELNRIFILRSDSTKPIDHFPEDPLRKALDFYFRKSHFA
jgi:hypothetical protein